MNTFLQVSPTFEKNLPPISILGQDECVRVKTIDRKGEEERFYSDTSESEEEEEETASEEEEDWLKPRRRSDARYSTDKLKTTKRQLELYIYFIYIFEIVLKLSGSCLCICSSSCPIFV